MMETQNDSQTFEQKAVRNKIKLNLREEDVVFRHTTSNSNSSTEIPYVDIKANTWEFTEQNEWLRNVGFLWVAIGVILPGTGRIWLPIGVGCLVYFWFTRVHFTVFDTHAGNRLFVIKDKKHDEIIATLMNKRSEFAKKKYGAIIYENEMDFEMNRFRLMHKEKIISDEEYESATVEIESYHASKAIPSPLSPGNK